MPILSDNKKLNSSETSGDKDNSLTSLRFFFFYYYYYYSSGTHCVHALPLCCFGLTELGCYSRDGSTSLFRQLLLSGPVTRSPTRATATCHRGGDSNIIVCDNVELQDPEHQLDG
jgi:hypothetical protein